MSNELKVTGGEWRVSDALYLTATGGALIFTTNESREITSLAVVNNKGGKIPLPEIYANANLLAASKKLYEALIQARESLADSIATPGGWYAIGSNHVRDVIAEIDAALAAARGEDQ